MKNVSCFLAPRRHVLLEDKVSDPWPRVAS